MDPEQWTSFFMLVGSGSAALAGLVFIVSALALMGQQTQQALGLEWLVVALPATAINTNGYVQAFRLRGSSRYALSPFRIVGGTVCYLGQIVGALALLLGAGWGINLAAVTLVANFAFLISGSWLLIMGTLPRTD